MFVWQQLLEYDWLVDLKGGVYRRVNSFKRSYLIHTSEVH